MKCEENYTTLLKDIKDLNKLGDKLPPQIERLSIVKMSVFSKLFYRLNLIPIKIPMSSFNMDLNKLILNFTQNSKDPKDS